MADNHGADDAGLLARLHRADPARSLPPVERDRVARLLEDAMSHDTLPETRESGARDRTPLTWLVAAAAAAVIASVAVVGLLGGPDGADDAGAPAADPGGAADPTVTVLSLPAGSAGRCLVPSAETLAGAAYAVDGEVTSVEDGLVTLEPTRWYAGGPTDEVRVEQATADRRDLVGAPRFEEGERYLVAGSADGDVMVCGFSAAWSPRLERLYEAAFGS